MSERSEWEDDNERYKEEVLDWTLRWPNHCRICSGFGVQYSDDLRGDIHTIPCDCIVACKCPRCANHLHIDTDEKTGKQKIGPCKTCGWSELTGGAPTF